MNLRFGKMVKITVVGKVSVINLNHHGVKILFEHKEGFAPLINEVQKVGHPKRIKFSFYKYSSFSLRGEQVTLSCAT